jgi:steroid 5-alpha reductase family enzyme
MSFLLLRVSGVTLLEKELQRSKPDYRHYTDKTNAFFPWFPR